jgi:hypothetical protein
MPASQTLVRPAAKIRFEPLLLVFCGAAKACVAELSELHTPIMLGLGKILCPLVFWRCRLVGNKLAVATAHEAPM